MPNLAAALKEEIRRLARKEIRAETGKTKRTMATYRSEIARLKQLLKEQQKKVRVLESRQQVAAPQPEVDDESLEGVRYSARSVRAQRKRLGLSAEQYGQLIGVSALTVYHWEQGKARPRMAQLRALIAVRGIKKREALSRLEAM